MSGIFPGIFSGIRNSSSFLRSWYSLRDFSYNSCCSYSSDSAFLTGFHRRSLQRFSTDLWIPFRIFSGLIPCGISSWIFPAFHKIPQSLSSRTLAGFYLRIPPWILTVIPLGIFIQFPVMIVFWNSSSDYLKYFVRQSVCVNYLIFQRALINSKEMISINLYIPPSILLI